MTDAVPAAAIADALEAGREVRYRLGETWDDTWDDTIEAALEAAAPHLAAAGQATITNLRNAIREAGAEMDRRYEMGAKAERQRILVSDETIHADGSIGPDAVPRNLRQDAAYWYRRWLFAMKMLDNEASERILGWPTACDEAAAAERQRIISIASQLYATIPADHPPGARASFADYLRVTSDPQPVGADAESGDLYGPGDPS